MGIRYMVETIYRWGVQETLDIFHSKCYPICDFLSTTDNGDVISHNESLDNFSKWEVHTPFILWTAVWKWNTKYNYIMFDVHYVLLPLHIIGEKNYTIIALFVSTLVFNENFWKQITFIKTTYIHFKFSWNKKMHYIM